jgi:hypothetical protein
MRWRWPRSRTAVGVAASVAAFAATAVLALTRNGGAGSTTLTLAAPSAGPTGERRRPRVRRGRRPHPFDRTVHRLLTEAKDTVDAGALLKEIAEGAPVPLLVEGNEIEGAPGLGLELVRRMVEHGLHGRFELTARPGRTRAEVGFPEEPR